MTNGGLNGGVREDGHQTDSVHFLLPGTRHQHFLPTSGPLCSRKAVSRTRVRPAGNYPSWKMRRMANLLPVPRVRRRGLQSMVSQDALRRCA
jgi:hypothetical protein